MALTIPFTFFPGITADTNGITIPYASLPGLAEREADPQGGDGRAVALAMVERIFMTLDALDNDNRPLGMVVSKSNPVGSGVNQVNQSYTVTFTFTYETDSVALLPEPLTTQPVTLLNLLKKSGDSHKNSDQ